MISPRYKPVASIKMVGVDSLLTSRAGSVWAVDLNSAARRRTACARLDPAERILFAIKYISNYIYRTWENAIFLSQNASQSRCKCAGAPVRLQWPAPPAARAQSIRQLPHATDSKNEEHGVSEISKQADLVISTILPAEGTTSVQPPPSDPGSAAPQKTIRHPLSPGNKALNELRNEIKKSLNEPRCP